MTKKQREEQATKLYEDFTGHSAETVETHFVELPDVGVRVGKCLGILYEATRDGEKEKYLHKFKKSAQPLLVASFDGTQLFIVGGRFRFTERGIVDL